jgi:hypothetical protein
MKGEYRRPHWFERQRKRIHAQDVDEMRVPFEMSDLLKNVESLIQQKDLYAQKIFGIEYFNWLDFWEQFHIVQKYDLDKNIITKEGIQENKIKELAEAVFAKLKK